MIRLEKKRRSLLPQHIEKIDRKKKANTLCFNLWNSEPNTSVANEGFSEVLMDSNNNYWFTKKADKHQVTIYVFDQMSGILKNFTVNGKPSFYEFEDAIYVACEGEGWQGWVYQFSKVNPEIMESWEVDGIFCDLEKGENALYISYYQVETDQAVLTIYEKNESTDIKLGKGFSPVNLLSTEQGICVAAISIHSSVTDKILCIKEDFEIACLAELDFSPRRLYIRRDELVVHGLNGKTGKSDQLVYISMESGKINKYRVPSGQIFESSDTHFSLYNPEIQTIAVWDHDSKSIISIREVSSQQRPNRFDFDFS
ncbi:hypothetical protein [Pseudalkalibacillus caeni]|uniref:S9 family peptidase n=1 Tax=Exobacillus caeni TaxID=2574798 RepID=A0A5R9F0K4_9BACL|nr:hypothetical protein [Pseudalkalibacillus caeni]TLS34948.1 hypothetical protein FCL54_23065 [Pseudalkalibacillus caeni]